MTDGVKEAEVVAFPDIFWDVTFAFGEAVFDLSEPSIVATSRVARELVGSGAGTLVEGVYALPTAGKRLIIGVKSDIRFSYEFKLPIDGVPKIDLKKLELSLVAERSRTFVLGREGEPGVAVRKVSFKDGKITLSIGLIETGLENLAKLMKAPADAPWFPIDELVLRNWILSLIGGSVFIYSDNDLKVKDGRVELNGKLRNNFDFELNPYLYGHLDETSKASFGTTKLQTGISTVSLDLSAQKKADKISLSLKKSDQVGRQMLSINDAVVANSDSNLDVHSPLILCIPLSLNVITLNGVQSIEFRGDFDVRQLEALVEPDDAVIRITSNHIEELILEVNSSQTGSLFRIDQESGFSCHADLSLSGEKIRLQDSDLVVSSLHFESIAKPTANTVELRAQVDVVGGQFEFNEDSIAVDTVISRIDGLNVEYTSSPTPSFWARVKETLLGKTSIEVDSNQVHLLNLAGKEMDFDFRDKPEISIANIQISPFHINAAGASVNCSNTVIKSAGQISFKKDGAVFEPVGDVNFTIESAQLAGRIGTRSLSLRGLGLSHGQPAFFSWKSFAPMWHAESRNIVFDWDYLDSSDPSKIFSLKGGVSRLDGFKFGEVGRDFLIRVEPSTVVIKGASFVSVARLMLPEQVNVPTEGTVLTEKFCPFVLHDRPVKAKGNCWIWAVASTLRADMKGRDKWHFNLKPNGVLHAKEHCTNSHFSSWYNLGVDLVVTAPFTPKSDPKNSFWTLTADCDVSCDVYRYEDNSSLYDAEGDVENDLPPEAEKEIKKLIPAKFTGADLSKLLKDNGVAKSIEIYSWKAMPSSSDFAISFSFQAKT